MNRDAAIQLIDAHKNQLLDPMLMLNWTWLRVIIHHLDDAAWTAAVSKANETMSR